MPDLPEPHKMRDSFHAAPFQPRQAAFQTTRDDGEMYSTNAAEEPRHLAAQGESRGMQCDLLRWAADQLQLTPHLQGVLLRLVRLMDERGAITLPQAKIAPEIRLGQTQARAAIKALVEAGAILRERRGSVGGGRQCDILRANSDNIGSLAVSAITSVAPEVRQYGDKIGSADTTEHSELSRDENSDNAGTSPVDNNSSAHIVHVGARAQTEPSNITTLSELNPERENVPPLADAPKRRAKGNYTPEFEAIWKQWPAGRRANSDKGLAFRRYCSGVARFGADKIDAAAKRYLSLPDTRKQDFQYCCLVEVFMNGKLEAAVEAIDDPFPVQRRDLDRPRPRANGITRLAYTG